MPDEALDNASLMKIYTVALRIRRTDERVIGMLNSGQIAIIYYPVTGQEVIAAAVGAVLRKDDYLVTTYRGMHDQVAKGLALGPMFAEYLGKATGSCKGKGGPMHITDPEHGVMVTSGIVGGAIPIANGLAWAAQLLGQDRVAVANFGDGAANIGAFHEAMNLAAVWHLPVVFVCQNNLYAEHTTYARSQRNGTVSARAEGYGMPGVTVNGNDAASIHGAVTDAVDRARSGGGPSLIEAMTYRFNGHYFGDPQDYMPAEEKKAAKAKDPVTALRAQVIASGAATEDELVALDGAIAAELDVAVEEAKAAPAPDESELFTDVYAEGVPV
jgi:acetoin:2,6-dichlorophenolindophenol oxidoreductase subunit alpha